MRFMSLISHLLMSLIHVAFLAFVISAASASRKACSIKVSDGTLLHFPPILQIDDSLEFSACGDATSCGRGVMACHKGKPTVTMNHSTVWHRDGTRSITADTGRVRLLCHKTREDFFLSKDMLHVISPHVCEMKPSDDCVLANFGTQHMWNFTALNGDPPLTATNPLGDTFYYGFCGGVQMGNDTHSCPAGTAVCRQFALNGSFVANGYTNDSTWSEASEGVLVSYGGKTSRVLSETPRSQVSMVCDEVATEPRMAVRREVKGVVELEIATRCACLGANGCVVVPSLRRPLPQCKINPRPSRSVYDFTALESATGLYVSTNDSHELVYNFCEGCSFPVQCNGSAVCLLDDALNATPIGTPATAIKSEVPDGVRMVYYNEEELLGAVVLLRCNVDALQPTMVYNGKQQNAYMLTIDTCYACKDRACAPPLCTFVAPNGDRYDFSVPARGGGFSAMRGNNVGAYNYCRGVGPIEDVCDADSSCDRSTTAVCVTLPQQSSRNDDTRKCKSAGKLETVIYNQVTATKTVDAYYFEGDENAKSLAHLRCTEGLPIPQMSYSDIVNGHYELEMFAEKNCRV